MNPPDAPELRPGPDHTLLRVRAAPGASRDAVGGLHGRALKVSVTAPPERGKANEAVARVLAAALGLRRSRVRIESGETSRDKWFRIEGIGADDLRDRLARLLP